MPPIPKFAKALAKLAKANPKVISGETPPKIKKRNTSEKTTEKQIKTKKFAKDDMELAKVRKEKIKNELEQRLLKQAKDDSSIIRNISLMKPDDKIEYYKAGEKVKIYDSNGTGKFVEVLWPKDATAEVLISLIAEKLEVFKK